jgi:peptidoglycan/LPS O-acetylase OafA/YrhL
VNAADSRGARGNSIGFLRLLLALAVLYSHSYILGGFGQETFLSWSRGTLILGTVGVQGFFVLSGALIARSWIGRASLGRFLWCRLLRLAPALWVCLMFTALVIGPILYFTTPGAHVPYFSLTPSPGGYILRNALNPRTQISIAGLPSDTPWAGDLNGSLWTLFYEGACYLLIAALGVTGLLGSARNFGASLLFCIVALYSLWALSAHLSWMPPHLGRLFDTPGKVLTMYFIGGTLWALFPNPTSSWGQTLWPGLAACALLIASWHWEGTRWLGPWLMPPALFWLAARLPFAGLERRVGDYSYGLYIYGYPAQQALAHFGANAFGHAVYLVAGVLIAGGLGAISWHFIENPALRLKNLNLPDVLKA